MPAAPVPRDLIVEKVRSALVEARDAGVLNLETLPDIAVERPANPEHGDFATSLPLRLAKSHRVNPLKIAEDLASRIDPGQEVKEVWAAPPGFVNFRLNDAWLVSQVESILQAGKDYGKRAVGTGSKALVEFVSVNPTGPVHVGHTRGAVIGSTLAAVMEAAGYDVTREYYVNDAGSQMETFYASVLSRYEEALGKDSEFPANGYRGEYVRDLAREIIDEHGDRFLSLEREEALRELGAIGREKMVEPHQGGPRTDRRQIRQLVLRRDSVRHWGIRCGDGTPQGWRARGRTGRGPVVQLHGPGRGQGQRAGEVHRGAHLLCLRHCLPPQQISSKGIRPVHQYLGSGPPGPCSKG